MSKQSSILSQYSYTPTKPKSKHSNLQIYDCTHKQTSLPYTLKIIRHPQPQLEQYLKKLKETTSEYVIKIYELAYQTQQNRIVFIQESCPYGNLEKALQKCKRFDNDDSVYIAKLILNGHIDLLRTGVTWFGTQADIQFTDNGLKLSWNNSVPFTDKSPFQDILKRISVRKQQSKILYFPPNKMMEDLIAVAKENASEISLHPILKKKDKIFKKKGKNWIAIREIKVKGEYFTQITYLGISSEFGLVRIKVMEEGFVDEDLMKIYQTNAEFVKILDYYTEKGQFFTISQYANDGNVQSYVKRIKTSPSEIKQSNESKQNDGTTQVKKKYEKEKQIQLFYTSLIKPLININRSVVGSLNLLHIRNIYIQNGIPKIGQPIPMNPKFKEMLIERADVPDFYHNIFKKDPSQKDPKFDTYSLGVLLYKLMYTQYPIFPEGKVHIPSAPTYRKNLKLAIELFLNVGGNLQDLQKQLQVSEDVKEQIKNNEKILQQVTRKNNKYSIIEEQQKEKQAESELEFKEDENKEGATQTSRFRRFWLWLTTRSKDPKGKYSTIYKSDYDNYRKCFTVLIVLMLYFFAFFIFYVNGVVDLFNYSRVFTAYSVSILGQTFKIITPNFDEFTATYSTVANNSISVLNQTLGCRIDNKLYYYDFVRSDSPHWNIYLALGLVTMSKFLSMLVIILTLKGIQLCKYSTARTGFHYYDTTISGSNQSRFALSTYVFFQLWFAFALYAYYYLFNYVFHEQHLPCFGGKNWTKLTQTLMLNRINFSIRYLIVLCIVFAFGVASFIQIMVYRKIKYNLLKNPIFVFTPFYIALFIALRLGAYAEFDPSFIYNSQQIIGSTYLDVVGYFPQLLIILEILICLGIDQLFYKFVFDKLHKFVVQQSHTDELKVYE